MKKGDFIVLSTRAVTTDTALLCLGGDTSAIIAPGQFVEIEVPGQFLRRPFSVCNWEDGLLFVACRRVGKGTETLTALAPGSTLSVLTGLGNGFDTEKSGDAPLLVGGGSGIAPLMALAKRLREQGKNVTAILGALSRDGLFLKKEFAATGATVIVTTEDGSLGIHGRVTTAMPGLVHSHVYACGPEPMLKAVSDASPVSGQFSLEERMGCGFGACMGCTRQMKSGPKRICKDGPVFFKEDILWQTSL